MRKWLALQWMHTLLRLQKDGTTVRSPRLKGKRALDIALSINDSKRVEVVRESLLRLEDTVAVDEKLGLWGFCFDLFVHDNNRQRPVRDDQQQKVVNDMEARLARLAGKPAGQYHPFALEATAVRLADYYRRSGKRQDVSRVLGLLVDAVRRMHGHAAALTLSHSLEGLYHLLNSYDLKSEADSLNELMRIVGEEALAAMKPISVEAKLTDDELDRYFKAMLAGNSKEILGHIAEHFIPQRNQVEQQVRRFGEMAPFRYLMPTAIQNEEGRTVAHVGPLEHDCEGNVLAQMSENMQISAWWLRESISRGLAAGMISKNEILDHLRSGPLFPPFRILIVEKGIDAYLVGNNLAALHILIPQLEQSIRQLAILLRAPFLIPRKMGGFHVRLLDDLLRDERICECLGDDIVTYFRVLLTDARGWNLRNDVCHGLASFATLSSPATADRILHALLVLGFVRRSIKVEEAL
jgi:hypothetical protein